MPDPLTSLENIRRAAHAAGSHFFDAATMRFFGCRLSKPVYALPDGSALFITSEQDRNGPQETRAWGGRRNYTVRLAFENPRCGFTTHEPSTAGVPSSGEPGDLGHFGTLNEARAFARDLKAAGKVARDLSPAHYWPQVECQLCGHSDGSHPKTGAAALFGDGPCGVDGCPCRSFQPAGAHPTGNLGSRDPFAGEVVR